MAFWRANAQTDTRPTAGVDLGGPIQTPPRRLALYTAFTLIAAALLHWGNRTTRGQDLIGVFGALALSGFAVWILVAFAIDVVRRIKRWTAPR